ncbi:MAG: ATP-binding cassette domain-containing protein [Coraliomargaritaceae bacterium]
MKQLIRLAIGRDWRITAVIALVNILSGVLTMAFLAHVRMLSENYDTLGIHHLIIVLILTFGIGLIATLSDYLIQLLVARTVSELIMGMGRFIINRPFREIEIHGRKSVDVIFRESRVIGKQIELLFKAGKDIIIILFLLAYAFSISPTVTLLTLAGGLFYNLLAKVLKQKIRSEWSAGRSSQVRLLAKLRHIYEGFKEISLNSHLGQRFFQAEVMSQCEGMRRARIKIAIYQAIFVNTAQTIILIFALIGGFIIMQAQLISLAEITSLLVAFLLARGKILTALKTYANREEFTVSVQHIEALGIDLEQLNFKETEIQTYPILKSHFNTLHFNNLTFEYNHSEEPIPFHVGPINATFRPGSVVFIRGKNGSGKSTIAKVLCGLYEPSGGSIELDGEVVKPGQNKNYQQMFGSVFSDFCLFSPRYYSEDPSYQSEFLELQEMFELDKDLITVDDLQTQGLSTGQRKRAALTLAMLEDKPIYILDEWAADQDPQFRAFFYEKILPMLAGQNKLIFVISHHEDYLHVADRVFTVDDGKMKESELNPAN